VQSNSCSFCIDLVAISAYTSLEKRLVVSFWALMPLPLTMDLIQSNAITTLHRLASVEDVVQFVRLCVEKNLTIDFILKDELDAFIKPSNNSGSWVRQQIDGVRVKAVDHNGFTVYAIWMRESLMKDYVTYLESITKTLSDASVFSFPVI
jgi:hypothetical protein